MAVRVFVEQDAHARLGQMSLTAEIIEIAIRRADAEAATCTAFDPPITAGFLRFARTVRFLREALVPQGWDYDNPINLSRVVHPSRKFAIVATSGDEATGILSYVPTTKYPKGYATVLAVDTNGQLAFDFGDLNPAANEVETDKQLTTWFLLYHRDENEIRAELSLPSAMTGGLITHWEERIILPPFSLDTPVIDVPDRPEDEGGEFVVEVNRRS